MRTRFEWTLPRAVVPLGERSAVMGILNVTPDSFSDAGRYFDREKAIARGQEMEQEGADIVDVGGESSRPGGEAIDEEEELRRVMPVIETLARLVTVPISVDTYRSTVARRAIEAGAQVVNDISGFRFDSEMKQVAAQTGAGVVLMHSRGSRENLHKQPRMENVIREVMDALSESARQAIEAGVKPTAVVIDPGIGFGKAAEESLLVLKCLEVFSKIGYPLLLGTSRKSFIGTIVSDVSDARDWGTAATIVAGIMRGAHIVRVHDVRRTRDLVDVTDRILD